MKELILNIWRELDRLRDKIVFSAYYDSIETSNSKTPGFELGNNYYEIRNNYYDMQYNPTDQLVVLQWDKRSGPSEIGNELSSIELSELLSELKSINI